MSIKQIVSSCVLAVLPVSIVILAVTFTGKKGDAQSPQIIFRLSDERETANVVLMPEDGKPDYAAKRGQGVRAFLPERPGSLNLREEEQRAYQKILKGKGAYPVNSPIRADDVWTADLNFDGWEDLCIRGRSTDGLNVPCYCMLWKPQKQKFEYSVTLCNVETDPENQWIISQVAGTEGESFITYCRYDAEDRLHMVRYVEENRTGETFEHLDLTYVDDEGPYTLQAIVDEERFNLTMVDMARQALSELYQWTGEKVDTACFQVSDLGGVVFSRTPEDMVHSRIFFSRYFGADTQYNLSGYDKSISSIGLSLGRRMWYSPVLWRVFPENKDAMTDEELISWYFERLPTSDDGRVKSIEERYEGMWTIQAESGRWFEVFYDKGLREVSDVTGPYPDIPEH